MRRRSAAANSGRGERGTVKDRSASKGSVGSGIGPSLVGSSVVGMAERHPRSDEQCLGGVDRSVEHVPRPRARSARPGSAGSARCGGAHRGVRAPRARGARRSAPSHGSSSDDWPAIAVSRRSSRAWRRQWSTSLWRATPMSHATDGVCERAPLDGVDGREERLGGEVLRHRRAAHPRREVAVDLRERVVVLRQQGRTRLGGGIGNGGHRSFIVADRPAPTVESAISLRATARSGRDRSRPRCAGRTPPPPGSSSRGCRRGPRSTTPARARGRRPAGAAAGTTSGGRGAIASSGSAATAASRAAERVLVVPGVVHLRPLVRAHDQHVVAPRDVDEQAVLRALDGEPAVGPRRPRPAAPPAGPRASAGRRAPCRSVASTAPARRGRAGAARARRPRSRGARRSAG